jgi:hypothetical protein
MIVKDVVSDSFVAGRVEEHQDYALLGVVDALHSRHTFQCNSSVAVTTDSVGLMKDTMTEDVDEAAKGVVDSRYCDRNAVDTIHEALHRRQPSERLTLFLYI